MTFINTKTKLFSILLLVGGFSAAIAYGYRRDDSGEKRRARGFTIVTKETIALSDPRMQAQPQQADYVITTRYQRSDGGWKEVKTSYKTGYKILRDEVGFGIPGEGAYKIDKTKGELIFLSQMPPKEVTSYVAVSTGHDNPKFLRDDFVQGYKTYVLHSQVDPNGSYEDEYNAPDLDGYPIKSVKVAPYGHSVTEPLSITLGEPDPSEFSSLPDLVVNYNQFKTKTAAIDRDGSRETAAALRKELELQLVKTKRKSRP